MEELSRYKYYIIILLILAMFFLATMLLTFSGLWKSFWPGIEILFRN